MTAGEEEVVLPLFPCTDKPIETLAEMYHVIDAFHEDTKVRIVGGGGGVSIRVLFDANNHPTLMLGAAP